MTTLEIAKKLIAIPSYIGEKTNEKKVSDFVFGYLNKFSFLKVTKQPIGGGRYNIIAKTDGTPRLLMAGHLDTVEPRTGWSYGQFEGTVRQGKLYGLGAYDMKGGVASMLASIQDLKDLRNVTMLFYCGEEYELDGMKKFIRSTTIGRSKPMVIIAEPTDLKIWNAHKGLIEIKVRVWGKTAHAAMGGGKNAIDGINEGLSELKEKIKKFYDKDLGLPSMNIASLKGGLYGGQLNNEVKLGEQGNNVADYAEAIIDIRTVSVKLDAQYVCDQLKQKLNKLGYKCETVIKHDFGPLLTNKKSFQEIEGLIKKEVGSAHYLDPKKRGYGDGQLLQNKFGLNVIYFGPKGGGMHESDEWVDVKSLESLRRVFSLVLESYQV